MDVQDGVYGCRMTVDVAILVCSIDVVWLALLSCACALYFFTGFQGIYIIIVCLLEKGGVENGSRV